MKTGVEIELPEVATPNISQSDEPLVVSINKKGEIYLCTNQTNVS